MLKSGPNEPKYKFPDPNPFVSEEEDGEVASVGYRYRKWNLNNGVVSLFYFVAHTKKSELQSDSIQVFAYLLLVIGTFLSLLKG